MTKRLVKIAAVQAASSFLDLEKTIEKASCLIAQAGENGAKLVVFPEAFIPGYPDWVWLVPNGSWSELNELYLELVQNAVSIPDSTTDRLSHAAKAAGVHVAMGIHERNTEASSASLYNTLLYIDNNGDILGKHRKLIPTGGERLIWAQGDGSTLPVFNTPFGRLGGLLCWENYMPLARQTMYNNGVEVYLAPTWDSSENWLLSMRHIAREGGMFLVNACQAVRVSDIPDKYDFKKDYPGDQEWINPGNSCIINPYGEVIAGPVAEQEEVLYAEVDINTIPKAKRMFDVAGHYARPDVFHFEVKRSQ